MKGVENPVRVNIKKKEMINHNTMRLVLEFDDHNLILGNQVGEHIVIFGKDE